MTVKIIAENLLDADDFLSATEQEGERWGQPEPAADNGGNFRPMIQGAPADFTYNGTATGNGAAGGTTVVDSVLCAYGSYYFVGATIAITSGACSGESKTVTGFLQASGTLTTAAFTAQIVSGVTFTLTLFFDTRDFRIELIASGDSGQATFKWSHNGGANYLGRDVIDRDSWDAPVTIADNADSTETALPGILVREDGTWVCYYKIDGSGWGYRTSTNEGLTWSSETAINTPTTDYLPEQGNAIKLSNGRWLIIAGYKSSGSAGQIIYSDDEGETYNTLVYLGHRIGPVCELQSGQLITVYNNGSEAICCRHSNDKGASWGSEITISAVTNEQQEPCVIQADNGYVVCAYVSDEDNNDDFEVKSKYSTDGGATWSAVTPAMSFDASHEYFAVGLVKDIDGTIYLVSVNDVGATHTITLNESINNGVSWVPNLRAVATSATQVWQATVTLINGHLMACLYTDTDGNLIMVRAGYWETYSANACTCAANTLPQKLACDAALVWYGGAGVAADDWQFEAEYDYAMTNLIEDSPSLPWRSEQDNIDCFIVLDPGAAARFYADGVAFFGCNLRTLTFEMNDTNVWTSPAVSEAVSFDLVTGSVETPELEDETGASWGPTVHGLSLADGVAFFKASGVDLSGFAGTEGTSTPYVVMVHDSASKIAKGYIGAADAAEALSGAELILNPGFETLTSGTDDDATSDNFETWIETTADADGSKALSMTDSKHGGARAIKIMRGSVAVSVIQTIMHGLAAGTLVKLSFWTRGDGTNAGRFNFRDMTNGVDLDYLVSTGVAAVDWTQIVRYYTVPAGCTQFRLSLYAAANPSTFAYFDDVSLQAVTHIGATGVHIVDTKDSSTRNWTDIEAGFNYNDSAYTFEIYRMSINEIGAATVLANYKDHELAGKYLCFTSGSYNGNPFTILDNVGGFIILDTSAALSSVWDGDTFVIYQDHVAKTFTGGAYRYVRISIGAQQTAENYYQIGHMRAGRAITPTPGDDFGNEKGHIINIEMLRTPAGGMIPIVQAGRQRTFRLEWSGSDEGRRQMLSLLDYIAGKNVCLIPNDAVLTACYLLKAVGSPSTGSHRGGMPSLSQDFEEVL